MEIVLLAKGNAYLICVRDKQFLLLNWCYAKIIERCSFISGVKVSRWYVIC